MEKENKSLSHEEDKIENSSTGVERAERGKKEKKEMKVQSSSRCHGLSLIGWIKVLAINILVTLSLIVLYHYKFSPQIAVVDFTGYLAGLKNLYLQGKISDSELRRRIDEAVSLIQNESKNKIILSSEVVYGKHGRIKTITLPQLPPEAYNFNMEEFLKQYSGKK